jgi:hypothetical protein
MILDRKFVSLCVFFSEGDGIRMSKTGYIPLTQAIQAERV